MKISIINKSISLKTLFKHKKNEITKNILFENSKTIITLITINKEQNIKKNSVSSDAIIYLLKGEIEILINEEIHILNTGKIIMIPANFQHSVFAKKSSKILSIRTSE